MSPFGKQASASVQRFEEADGADRKADSSLRSE
jgi:hypothetical protein